MNILFKIALVSSLLFSALPQPGERTVPVMDFNTFESYLHLDNDTTYVINFWATWCRPCVAELPYFEQVHTNYEGQKLKVILVSLDFPGNIDSQLIPFLDRKNIQSEVILLDDPDADAWINRVDSSWSGAIPATIIYNRNSRAFFEQEFTQAELDSVVASYF